MNVFWKTILTAVVTIAAIVTARYSAAWVASKTYRADRVQQASAAPPAVKPSYTGAPSVSHLSFTPPPQSATRAAAARKMQSGSQRN